MYPKQLAIMHPLSAGLSLAASRSSVQLSFARQVFRIAFKDGVAPMKHLEKFAGVQHKPEDSLFEGPGHVSRHNAVYTSDPAAFDVVRRRLLTAIDSAP